MYLKGLTGRYEEAAFGAEDRLWSQVNPAPSLLVV